MGIQIDEELVYVECADYQVLYAGNRRNLEYIARKLKKEFKKGQKWTRMNELFSNFTFVQTIHLTFSRVMKR